MHTLYLDAQVWVVVLCSSLIMCLQGKLSRQARKGCCTDTEFQPPPLSMQTWAKQG